MTGSSLKKQKSSLESHELHEQTSTSYGPYKSGQALTYFMKWAHGSIEKKMRREVLQHLKVVTDTALVEKESQKQTALRAAALLEAAEVDKCGQSFRRSWSLLEQRESRGVEHLVLRSNASAPKLQFLALQHGKIMAADPPLVCLIEQPGVATRDTSSDGGGGDLLDPKTDPLVQDCKKLLLRTVEDRCKKTFQIKVIQATRQVIDGFEVNMDVELTGPLGKTTSHHPSCLFEKSLDHKDASLLQKTADPAATDSADPADTDPTEEEKSGLFATLTMHTELCEADEKNGVSTGTSLGQRFAFGELSRYKGYEHVNDDLPLIEVPLKETAPAEVDHRQAFPECFPEKDGMEVVRNQGQCGSCWAFASASSAMNNLCVSNHGELSLASKDDRFEVSVQQIMSCNAQKVGCDGGYAAAANSAVLTAGGPSKERDYTYECGAGDPANHFDQSSPECSSFPWGASCVTSNSAVPGWLWNGMARVEGASSMMALMADGQSLYVSMDVYGNFMDWTTGVYTTLSGGKKGGHAMTGIGYGTEGGTPYWLLQNSWGPASWGVEGFGKVLRGKNLAGIEQGASWLKAWVQGGKQPVCEDGETTGYTSGGVPIPCSDAKGYGNLCTDASVQSACPVTCDSCLVAGTPILGSALPAANKKATPAPTPAPTPPPAASADGCIGDATHVFRNMYPCVISNKCSYPVHMKCTSPCEQEVGAGAYTLLSCNGKIETDVCKQRDECTFWKA